MNRAGVVILLLLAAAATLALTGGVSEYCFDRGIFDADDIYRYFLLDCIPVPLFGLSGQICILGDPYPNDAPFLKTCYPYNYRLYLPAAP